MPFDDYEAMAAWITPFYLRILHANYCHLLDADEQDQFVTAYRDAADTVTTEMLRELIESNWRPALTGSWFAGVLGHVELRDLIGRRLIESSTCYAGQAHAFAMACFCDDESANFLVRYLRIYLQRRDCFYDQHWALPALMWVDANRGTSLSEAFLEPRGAWEFWAKEQRCKDIGHYYDHFVASMNFVNQRLRR